MSWCSSAEPQRQHGTCSLPALVGRGKASVQPQRIYAWLGQVHQPWAAHKVATPRLIPPKKCTFSSAIPSLHPIRTLPSRPAQATWASCVWRGQERRRAHPGRARWKADAIFALRTFLTMSFGKNLSFVTKKVVKILLCMRSSVQP